MANEPSWDELFNPQPKASEPARPEDQQPAPGETAAQQPQQPQQSAPETDPFAALFAGFETGPTQVPAAQPPPAQPVQPAQPVYDVEPQTPVPPQYEVPVQQQPTQQPTPPATPPAQSPQPPQVVQQPYPPEWAAQQAAAQPPVAPQTPAQPTPAASNQAASAPAASNPADPFAEMFASQPDATPARAASAESPPLTRREMREREAQGGAVPGAVAPAAAQQQAFSAPANPEQAFPQAAFPEPTFGQAAVPAATPTTAAAAAAEFPFNFGVGSGGDDGSGSNGSGGGYYPPEKPRRRRSLLWLKITLPIVLVLGAIGGAAAFAWFNYEDQVRELMGWELPNDYLGAGNGIEVIVTIQSGEIGSDIARTLHDKGVTMTFDAFYDLLLAQPENVAFFPGNYALQKEMSAQAALDALLDPANKVTSRLLLTEGTTLPNALEIMAGTTGIPLEEFEAAAADYEQFGVPAVAPSLEGYLFPATYELDGTETAVSLLQLLVDTMYEHLDDAGVPVEMRHEILTKASIVQREAGSNQDDFYKIARVFQNRIDQGINLQSDATVAYGTGNLHTVWTTDAERADASNPYNTYANAGLPIGPIGLPGDLAIAAAMMPADGPWLFFVPINLATGETVFSETADQHEAAVEVLREWCRASPENASYCE